MIIQFYRPEHGHGGGAKWIWVLGNNRMDKSDSGLANECPTDIEWKDQTTFRCAKKKRNTDDVTNAVLDGVIDKSVDKIEYKNITTIDGIKENTANFLKDTNVYDITAESVKTTKDTILNNIEYTSVNTLEYTSLTTKDESPGVNIKMYTSSKAVVNQESKS